MKTYMNSIVRLALPILCASTAMAADFRTTPPFATSNANPLNIDGGGIAISDDGGFFDYNDGAITYKNLCCDGGLRVDSKLSVTGNVEYEGQLNKLDVADNFVATVRCADFIMGHSGRRGAPGRALVDWGSTLVLNWESDWSAAAIGSSLGIGTVSPGAKLHVVNSGAVGVFSGDLNPFGTAEFESNISTPSTHAWFAENGNRVFSLTAGGVGYFASDVEVGGQVRATTLLLTSDRNAKANFEPVDSRDVLKKLSNLQVTTWDYTNAPGVRHIGPMAQDFKAAYNLGEDDKHIATVDADGVLFASVKALHELIQEKDATLASLREENAALKMEMAGLRAHVAERLASLEKAMVKDIAQASLGTSSTQ